MVFLPNVLQCQSTEGIRYETSKTTQVSYDTPCQTTVIAAYKTEVQMDFHGPALTSMSLQPRQPAVTLIFDRQI